MKTDGRMGTILAAASVSLGLGGYLDGMVSSLGHDEYRSGAKRRRKKVKRDPDVQKRRDANKAARKARRK